MSMGVWLLDVISKVPQTLSYLFYVLHNPVNIEIKLLWSIMLGCNLALNINQSWNNFWCQFKIPPMSQSCLVLPVWDTTAFLWPPVIKYHPINCNQVSIQKGFEIGWKWSLPDNFYFCVTSSMRIFLCILIKTYLFISFCCLWHVQLVNKKSTNVTSVQRCETFWVKGHQVLSKLFCNPKLHKPQVAVHTDNAQHKNCPSSGIDDRPGRKC